MRIPRKLKKKFKLIWEKQYGVKHIIIKKSIEKKLWGNATKKVWGCMVNKTL
jgi:hypothetical protein